MSKKSKKEDNKVKEWLTKLAIEEKSKAMEKAEEEERASNNESPDSNYFIPKADGTGLFNQLNEGGVIKINNLKKYSGLNYEDFLATPVNKTTTKEEDNSFVWREGNIPMGYVTSAISEDPIDHLNSDREERLALYYDELITKEVYITYNGILKVKFFDDPLLIQETVESDNIRYYVEPKDPNNGNTVVRVDFLAWIELSLQGAHYCYFEIIDKNKVETQPKTKKNPFISELVHLATYEFKHDCKCEDIKDCTGKCNLTNEEFQEKLLEILNKYNKQEDEL